MGTRRGPAMAEIPAMVEAVEMQGGGLAHRAAGKKGWGGGLRGLVFGTGVGWCRVDRGGSAVAVSVARAWLWGGSCTCEVICRSGLRRLVWVELGLDKADKRV